MLRHSTTISKPDLICVYANQLRAPASKFLATGEKDMFTGRVCKGSPFGEVNFRREITNVDLSVLPF